MSPVSSHLSTNSPFLGFHPMDTSRLLNSLLKLVNSAKEETSANPLKEIIHLKVLRRLLSALCYRDPGTLKHSRRVGILSVGIGYRLGWEERELRLIEVAALLHDLGKIGIPDHILHKPGKLSPDEAEYIASFHRVAVELLQACSVHRELVKVVAQSHGIDCNTNQSREKEVCLGARILAVADAYESLTCEQAFRPAFDEKQALNILQDQSGKGFDRNVVAALERWLNSNDAESLNDQQAADAAVSANSPTSDLARENAAGLCYLFQYLHLVESLYDACYIVDSQRKIAMWSMGAAKLFNFPASDLIANSWHRSIVAASSKNTDPIEVAFAEKKHVCHSLVLKDIEGATRELGVQSVPILDEEGYAVAVAEFICDNNESKRNRGQFRKLQIAATRDALTGVVNRGELDQQLSQVHAKWENEPTIPYSVVFLDIDHFKAINDRLSHAVGDRVLVDVARLVQDELYSGEVVGRYGGEEFVILCPETPLETALERGERLRRAIVELAVAGREEVRVTASFGVAQVETGDTPESVIKRADQALYDAKNSGRNCVCHRATHRIKDKLSDEASQNAKSWIHYSEIVTCVASAMLPMKLKGFVQDNFARIIDVKDSELLLHVGSSALLGGWGGKPEKQPVKIQIEIVELPRNEKNAGTKRLLLKTTTEPIGRPSKHETFHNRAIHVTEVLRSYLIAD